MEFLVDKLSSAILVYIILNKIDYKTRELYEHDIKK